MRACAHVSCVVVCEVCDGEHVGWWPLCLLYTSFVAVCVSAHHAGRSIVLQSTMYTASSACSEWFVFWFWLGLWRQVDGVCLQQ